MIYHILTSLIFVTFRIFFSKVYFANRNSIPRDRAVLFAVNHPTAFLDPILVAAYIGPSTSFLLRGDMFGSPFINWLLHQIKTIPIFRARDGYSALKNNQKSLDRVYKLLHKGKNVLVLAEGQTEYEKRLRPIQKGTGRIAVEVYKLHPNTKLCVLPLGINYSDSNEFRSEVMAAVGTPMNIEDYIEVIEENPRKAVKQITDEITRQLKDLVVHIEDDADAPFINRILDFRRNDRNRYLLPAFKESSSPLEDEVATVKRLNDKSEAEKKDLREKVETYDAFLSKHNLKDVGLARPGFFSILNTLFLIIGLPVFLIGFLQNWPFFTLSKNYADAKIKKPAFHSSIRFGLIMVPYFIAFSIVFIVLLLTGNWWWLAILFLLPVAGFLSLTYRDLFLRWSAVRAWRKIGVEEKERMLELRGELVK